MQTYINVHNHSEYSKLDGKSRPKELVEAAKAFGMSAVAVSDHRNVDGAVPFYKAATKEGIKPILGAEVEEIEDRLLHNRAERKARGWSSNHLLLLARNDEGYKNLLKIVSDAATLGQFDRKECTDFDFIRKNGLGKGLYASTACMAGRIPRLILAGQIAEAKGVAMAMSTLFDQLFLELQPHDTVEQNAINQGLVEIASSTGLPLIVTCDSHYIKPEEKDSHDTLICIQTAQVKYDPQRRFKFGDGYNVHFWSPEDIWNWVVRNGYPLECITNTIQIAQDCNVEIKMNQRLLPPFHTPNGQPAEDYLTEWSRRELEGFLQLYPYKDPPTYRKQLEYELHVINSKGYAPYFLIIADMIKFCVDNDIPVGPGRGSSAGSLVAYMLRITDIDPIEHELVFERFLNPERDSLPDIDTDICYFQRHRVIDYFQQRYGSDRVSQIATYTTNKLKNVTKDVMRAYGINHTVADELTKLIPPKIGQRDTTIKMLQELESDPAGDLAQAAGLETAKQTVNNWHKFLNELRKFQPEVERDIKALEGLVRGTGVHAGGVILSPGPLTDYAAIRQGSEVAVLPVISLDMEDVDDIGMLKVDVLGSRTVTVIDQAAKMAGVNYRQLPKDDPKVWKAYQEGHNHAVFQMQGRGITDFGKRIGLSSFQELVDLLALFRPGPLEAVMDTGNTMADQYVVNKNDPSQIAYPHPDAEPLLKKTKGIIIYQEQIMTISQKFAGYTLGGADSLRRAVGKKKHELMKSLRDEFVYGIKKRSDDGTIEYSQVPGCTRASYTEELGNYLFDLIQKFAGYGFNVAHSTVYAENSYRTQWLKVHFPAEFMTAVLDSEITSLEKTQANLKECKRLGLKVLPPDINRSGPNFAIELDDYGQKCIRFGLVAVKGLGEGHIAAIMAGQPYVNLADLNARVAGRALNKNHVGNLIKAGAFDRLYPGKNRYELLNEYHFIVKKFKQVDASVVKPKSDEAYLLDITQWEKKVDLNWEQELLGGYITGHPLDWLPHTRWEYIPNRAKCEVGGIIKSVRKHVVSKGASAGKEMCFLTLETAEDFIDVTVFSDAYTKHRNNCRERAVVIVRGKKEANNNCIVADEIVSATRFKRKAGPAPVEMPRISVNPTEVSPIIQARQEWEERRQIEQALLNQYG